MTTQNLFIGDYVSVMVEQFVDECGYNSTYSDVRWSNLPPSLQKYNLDRTHSYVQGYTTLLGTYKSLLSYTHYKTPPPLRA